MAEKTVETNVFESGARDVLNIGLGVVKTAEEGFANLRKEIETRYTDLVARGASDNSEATVGLRRNLDQGINGVKELREKVESTFSKN